MSPFVMVIFGATGDLTRNKLLPALFSLFKQGLLGEKFYIIGFSRREMTDEVFRDLFADRYTGDDSHHWKEFARNLYYQQGTFEEKEGYNALVERLMKFDSQVGACITRLFYLATPPDNYNPILDNLVSSKLSEGCGPYFAKATQGKQGAGIQFTKLIIEKPFGKDLDSARLLDEKLATIFEEEQIFRVDHYLGKETVQNIIAFRFANSIFEPTWNKEYIDHVQITFAEEEGVRTRGKFFDGVGILRDVAQNHLLQLVATVAMEQPRSFTKESVRDARVAAIQAIECITPEEVPTRVVRGQYEGYLEEKAVAPNSQTETFVAMKFFVNTERFRSVPFYVRTGKKMTRETVEISIVFKQTCHILFKEYGCPEIGNILKIRIQPDEGISLRVNAKKPFGAAQNKPSGSAMDKTGSKLALGTVDMHFTYHDEFGGKGADAYEKLLMDIFSGDQMLFNRSDELASSWEFITNILTGWSKQSDKPIIYKEGTWGPKEADDLLAKDGKKWL